MAERVAAGDLSIAPTQANGRDEVQVLVADMGAMQDKLAELKEMFERLLPQLRGAPMITVSGKTGRGLDRLHDAILKAHEVWNRRIPTARLNTQRTCTQHVIEFLINNLLLLQQTQHQITSLQRQFWVTPRVVDGRPFHHTD